MHIINSLLRNSLFICILIKRCRQEKIEIRQKVQNNQKGWGRKMCTLATIIQLLRTANEPLCWSHSWWIKIGSKNIFTG